MSPKTRVGTGRTASGRHWTHPQLRVRALLQTSGVAGSDGGADSVATSGHLGRRSGRGGRLGRGMWGGCGRWSAAEARQGDAGSRWTSLLPLPLGTDSLAAVVWTRQSGPHRRLFRPPCTAVKIAGPRSGARYPLTLGIPLFATLSTFCSYNRPGPSPTIDNRNRPNYAVVQTSGPPLPERSSSSCACESSFRGEYAHVPVLEAAQVEL